MTTVIKSGCCVMRLPPAILTSTLKGESMDMMKMTLKAFELYSH